MKKIVVFLCLILLAVFVFPATVAKAETEPYSLKPTEFLNEFLTTHKNRTFGTEGNKNAAQYLAEKFEKLGVMPFNDLNDTSAGYLMQFNYILDSTYASLLDKEVGTQLTGNNIVGVMRSADSQGTVLLSAAYDNAADMVVYGNKIGGEGASNNACGVAALLETAKELSGKQLNFDVIFVLYDASELAFLGAKMFMAQLDNRGITDDIIININYKSIGAGDQLYIYSGEFGTHHGKYLESLSASARVAPRDLKFSYYISYVDGVPYYHVGQDSDHIIAQNNNIPFAYFVSCNWETSGFGFIESKKNPNIIYTQDDTYDKLTEYYGSQLDDTILDCARTVAKALTTDSVGFLSALQQQNNAPYWMFSLKNAAIFSIVVCAVIVAAVLYYHKQLKTTDIEINKQVKQKILDHMASNKPAVFGDEFEP